MTGIVIYATSAELATWTGTAAPANAAALLRAASLRVREATSSALYETDATGKPTDADLLQAVKDATCSHAAALAAAGIDPAAAGTDAQVASTSIGSASVSYAGADGAAKARLALTYSLCPEGVTILRDAGLYGNPPMTFRA